MITSADDSMILPARAPAQTPLHRRRSDRWRDVRRNRHFYYFIAPFFILFAIFGLYPLVFSLILSFIKWDGLTPMHFAGLHNFRLMLDDELLTDSLWNTLVIGVLYIPPMLVGALLLAIALNSAWLRAKSFFRAAIFVPCVTPMVVIAIVFGLMMSPEHGLFNELLGRLHVGAVPWLNSVGWSKISVSLLVLWRWTGYNMVLMLAGLQGIDADYYEAASVDGAGPLRKFWNVTLPLMRPIFLFCLILSVIGTVYMFDEPFVLTKGGPGDSSTNFGLYLFNVSFSDFRFGYASCVAYSVSIAVLIVSLFLNAIRKKGET